MTATESEVRATVHRAALASSPGGPSGSGPAPPSDCSADSFRGFDSGVPTQVLADIDEREFSYVPRLVETRTHRGAAPERPRANAPRP